MVCGSCFVLDGIWKEVMSSNPFLAGAMIGQGIGKFASNLLFSTDETIESYYSMEVLYGFEDALKEYVKRTRSSFEGSKTTANAKKFIQSAKLLFRLHKIGIDYAIKFNDVVNTKGLFNKIFKNVKYEENNKALQNMHKSAELCLDTLDDEAFDVFCDEYGTSLNQYGNVTSVERDTVTDAVYSTGMQEFQIDAVKSSNLTITENYMLMDDLEIYGDLNVNSGTLDLNGHTLKVRGDAQQPGGTVKINGGKLKITGDYKIQTVSTDANGKEKIGYSTGTLDVKGNYEIEAETYNSTTGNYDKTNSSGTLKMIDTADVVKVAGNFVMHSGIGHSGDLKGGTMYIQGDFTQVNGSSSNFTATGTHTVVLDGSKLQKIKFESASSYFNNLKLLGKVENHYKFINTPFCIKC